MLERKLIEHCAPTLAGLKSANLLNYRFSSVDNLNEELQMANRILNKKGVAIEVLKINDIHALLYVYREKSLEQDLKKEGVKELLSGYGYTDYTGKACLKQLKNRFSHCGCFPHEIGVFLSYPIEDVKEFIRQEGKNCKCCGVWKVYCNEYEAVKLFARFQQCTKQYMELFAQGWSLMQLTVTA